MQHRPAIIRLKKSSSIHIDGQPRRRDRSRRILMKIVMIDLKNFNIFKDSAPVRSKWEKT